MISTFIALVLTILMVFPRSIQAQQATNSPKVLRIATFSDLTPGINTKDARLALEIIMQKTLLHQTDPFRVKLNVISDFSQTGSLIAQHRYQFLAMVGSDYAKLKQSIALTPLIILSRHERPTETVLLVSRKSRDLIAIAKDDKRVLTIDQSRSGELSRIWLDTVLFQAGYPASERFFTTIKRANKPSQVLLPVFFGQADACVITASAFALMAEFNPQVEKRLSVLTRSPELVLMLLCATQHAAPEDRKIVLKEASKVEQDPAVQQALTIVQMKRFIPCEPKYLKQTENLVERHRQLKEMQIGGNYK